MGLSSEEVKRTREIASEEGKTLVQLDNGCWATRSGRGCGSYFEKIYTNTAELRRRMILVENGEIESLDSHFDRHGNYV